MKMSLVPPDQITKAWAKVSGFLDAASKTVRQRHDIVDIFEDCLVGRQLLWVVFDDEDENKVMGAMTTSVIKYPQYTALNIPYMGGDHMMSYRDLIIDTLSRFARDNGFGTIETYGRDAWGKFGEKYGFVKSFSTFELDLSEEIAVAAE
jgi:hypothetical protein